VKVIKPEVEAEGFAAFNLGDKLEDNPYHKRDFRSTDWAVGWQRGKLESDQVDDGNYDFSDLQARDLEHEIWTREYEEDRLYAATAAFEADGSSFEDDDDGSYLYEPGRRI
jgi:hypothetical protein